MGKCKYQSVRLGLSMKSREGKEVSKTGISLFPGGSIPKILTYKELNKIDIGQVYKINDEYISSLELDASVNGAYGDLAEYLPRLAKSYLTTNRQNALQWYGKTEGTFMFALGGDDCPFGKHESACSFFSKFPQCKKKGVASNYDSTAFLELTVMRHLQL